MKKNMGLADRVIRLLVAIFLFDLASNNTIRGAGGILLWVVAGILFATSLFARCPLYSALKIHTNAKPKPNL